MVARSSHCMDMPLHDLCTCWGSLETCQQERTTVRGVFCHTPRTVRNGAAIPCPKKPFSLEGS